MVTRLCESNVCGITTMMKRKAINNIYPQIGYVFCNLAEGKSTARDELTKEKDDLMVSVLTEGHSFLENLAELKMKPHRCLREATNTDPFTLYQKVGHGSLEMYTLSPPKDSKEVKEFLQQWASCKENFSRVKTGVSFQEREISIPLSHAMSICSLVVWRPSNPEDTITRIFFPGSAPQNRIFEGLEKLKNLDVLKQPVCSYSSLHPTEKTKPKISSKGLLTKNTVTSSLISNGIRRSSESLGSKKDPIESKQGAAEKVTAKAPIKKEVSKSPPELKKKEVKRTPPLAIKKEVKEKKPVSSPKPVEIKKTTKPVEANKAVEPKTKGLKEVTNKKTIDSKPIKRKPEAPKPKPTPVPKAAPKSAKPSTQSPKHVPKPTDVKKITSIKSVKSPEKKNKSNEEKSEKPKEEKLNEPVIKLETEAAPLQVKEVEQIHEQNQIEEIVSSTNNDQIQDKNEEIISIITKEASPVVEQLEENEIVTVVAENKDVTETEEKFGDSNICNSNSFPIENDEKLVDDVTSKDVPSFEGNEKFVDDAVLAENISLSESKEKLNNDFSPVQQQSATDLFLATASMEGSMHEGLIGSYQDFNKESYIQKETDLLEHPNEKETEDKLAVEDNETIEEKSEKESLHDVMGLENNEEEEENALTEREEKMLDSTTSFKEYEEKSVIESVITQHEEMIKQTVSDGQYITSNETVTVKCEDLSEENAESQIVINRESPIISNKANLSVDIQSYSDDDDDVVKSPTPVAIVDYKDEEVLETYKAVEHNEKYVEDGPENEKASKDEDREVNNDEQFDVLMLETEKPGYDEEKESSSFSEDEKDDEEEEEEMIRHPTPPGEQNFYGKIGASDMPTNVEELDTRFMEHYLPVTRQTPDSCHEPLYEEMEDEGESDSDSPVMEQPVYSNVLQADYPEFVNISGGTTPSDPQSPKSLHDSKLRLPDVSELSFKDMPPQESDEDKFKEEQNALKEITSNTTMQESIQEYEKEDVVYSELKEEKHIPNLSDNEEGPIQSTNEVTNKTDDLYSEHDATVEEKNILQNTSFPLQTQCDSPINDNLLVEDDEYRLKEETDIDHLDHPTEIATMDNISQQQEPTDEYNKYSSINEDTERKLPSEAESFNTETDVNILQHDVDDLTKFTMRNSNPFGSHGMDQSFHESYIETEELNEPITHNTESYIGKDNTEDPYSSYTIEQETTTKLYQHNDDQRYGDEDAAHSNLETKHEEMQSIHDYNVAESEKFLKSDSKEKIDSDYDKEERYGEEMVEKCNKDYITDSYRGEEKDEEDKYYREERDGDYATEKYYKMDRDGDYPDEVIEEGYYGDNERSQFADYDCATQRTTYSYETTSTNDSGTISAERKELFYSTTTNGVNLPRDINGHQTDMWRNKGLSSYGEKDDDVSFRNEQDGYDKSPSDYNNEQDLYTGMTVSDSAYVTSEFKKSDHHYTDAANVDDILLERKDTTIEKTSFSSMSCSYSNKNYHQEQEDNAYSEQVSGLLDLQKDSSTGFRLEDWSKPLGLPSPPEAKTTVKTATRTTNKLEKKPKVAENVKASVNKSSPKPKPKSNGGSASPVYVDLSYVPHHGDPNYSDVDFFRRVRARYYVFSGINPSKEVLNALLEAKKSWKDDSEVTIIPTYETDTLGYWMALNQDSLIENKIDVAPSASRCTVNLQDHETSCAAYRLEF